MCADKYPSIFLRQMEAIVYNYVHVVGGVMAGSALVSAASGPGSSPGWGHYVVFLSKTLKVPMK